MGAKHSLKHFFCIISSASQPVMEVLLLNMILTLQIRVFETQNL